MLNLFGKSDKELKDAPSKDIDFYRNSIWNGKSEVLDHLEVYSTHLKNFVMDLERNSFWQTYKQPAKDLEKLIDKYKNEDKGNETLIENVRKFNNDFISFKSIISAYNSGIEQTLSDLNVKLEIFAKDKDAKIMKILENKNEENEYDAKQTVTSNYDSIINQVERHYASLLQEKCPVVWGDKSSVNYITLKKSSDILKAGTLNSCTKYDIYQEKISKTELEREIDSVSSDMDSLKKSIPTNLAEITSLKLKDIVSELERKKEGLGMLCSVYDECIEYNKIIGDYRSKQKELEKIKNDALFLIDSSDKRLLRDLEGNIIYEKLYEFSTKFGKEPILELFGDNLKSFMEKYEKMKNENSERTSVGVGVA